VSICTFSTASEGRSISAGPDEDTSTRSESAFLKEAVQNFAVQFLSTSIALHIFTPTPGTTPNFLIFVAM
jgi:hypothetical protein